MTDRHPESERFNSPRDAALYRMAMGQWACESAGMLQAPTGWFAWMTNSAPEIPEIVDAFSDEFTEVGLADPQQLVGNFLLKETVERVTVSEFETEDAVRTEYDRLERELDAWEAGGVQ